LLYGLGSETQNLPGYVVLNSGRGASGSTSNWSSGFLPTTFQGVPLRGSGEPVLNLRNPPASTRYINAALRRHRAAQQPASRHVARPRDCQPHRAVRTRVPHAGVSPELTDLSANGSDARCVWREPRDAAVPTAELQSVTRINASPPTVCWPDA